ncbi:MAG: DNA alkylation repair protein [Bacteroidetes bacterium]|nr:DNA alkylation repair protein [Bacteroidota bacterium]
MIFPLVQKLESEFEKYQNDAEAGSMSRYMKNRFVFYGIKKPTRAPLQKSWFSTIPKNFSPENKRELVFELWQREQREFHYVAMDYIVKWKDTELTIEDLSFLEFLLTNHSWWDSVDNLASNFLGRYLRLFPNQRDTVINSWRKSDNMWLRRSCLIFQLRYKSATNFTMLKGLILELKNEKEFFIQKAIGWSLREYAKTNPESVRAFVEKSGLQGLAKREALKHFR